jgi:hypothetical protein
MADPVQSVGVATALALRYRAIAEAESHSHLELTIGEARQIYPEMWRHLDEARIALGERGVDCTPYDNVRRQELDSIGVHVGTTVGVEFYAYGLKVGEIYKKAASFDLEGAHRALEAIATLRHLMPDVDWAARARENDRLIREAGSLKTGTWIGIAKIAGAGVAIAIVALILFNVLSNAGSEQDTPPPTPSAHVVDTPKKPVGPPDPVKLAARARCDKARQRIQERVAKEQGLVRDSHWSMTCEGILIDNQPIAFAVSVQARSKGALVSLRGIASLDGMHDLKPFVAAPQGTSLAFVGDLDRDTSDELVFVGQQSLIITKITKAGFVDIEGPPMPTGCSADAKVSGDYRNGRTGEREDLILTVPEGQAGSNCLSPGKHYFWLVGDHLEET